MQVLLAMVVNSFGDTPVPEPKPISGTPIHPNIPQVMAMRWSLMAKKNWALLSRSFDAFLDWSQVRGPQPVEFQFLSDPMFVVPAYVHEEAEYILTKLEQMPSFADVGPHWPGAQVAWGDFVEANRAEVKDLSDADHIHIVAKIEVLRAPSMIFGCWVPVCKHFDRDRAKGLMFTKLATRVGESRSNPPAEW